MGPPTGWHRLRLLRQIGDQLVAGLEQFLLINNVVAVEDGAALVSGQEHGNPLGDAGADQVAGGGAATVVEEAGRHPGRLAGGEPRRAPAADRDPITVEDERAVGVAACPPSCQGLGDGLRDGKNPPHQSLRARGREPDDAARLVDLLPGEAEDLLLAPAGIVGEVENVLPRGGQVDTDGEVFGVLEEALAGGILAQPVGEPGHGVEPAPVDGEGAHAVEGRGLPVDGAGGRPGGTPGELILADLVGGQGGGPRVAAEERSEMGGPAAGGAVGPELPDQVVLEVGVDEVPQGRPLRAECTRGRCRRAGDVGAGWPSRVVWVHWTRVLLSGATGGGRRSTFALVGATGKGNVRRRRDGDGTRGVRAQASPTGRPAGHVSAPIRRAPCDESWRRHPDGRGSRVHISPLADRARALRDESVGCDDRGVTLMGPEALSEGGIDAGRPRGLIEKISSASGPPSVRG